MQPLAHRSSSFLSWFFFGLCLVAYGILAPRPGIEPRALAVRTSGPNHWATREIPPPIPLLWSLVYMSNATYIPISWHAHWGNYHKKSYFRIRPPSPVL